MSRRRLAGLRTRSSWQQLLMTLALGGLLVTVVVGFAPLLAMPARDDGMHRETQAASPAPWSTADASYVQAMLWRQDQAREMASLVQGRTTRPELRALARSMLVAQSSTDAQLTAWLRARGAVDNAVHRSSEQEGRWFAGMMAATQLQTLASTTGQRFDFLFVDMLLEHHKGAVVMAQEVLVDGRDPEVRFLAARATTYSQRSIRQLTGWRRRWAEPFIRQLTSPDARPMPASC